MTIPQSVTARYGLAIVGYSPAIVNSDLPPESSGRRDADPRDDVTLLADIALGDETAFRAFYSRYAGRTLSILRRLCPDSAVAEDLLQEAFLAVWRKASTYRPDRGDPAGWLYTITRNKVFDHGRRRAPVVPIDAEESAKWRAPNRRSDLGLSLKQALGTLKDSEREALETAYFGGFTYQESAEHLSVPLGTLKSRIRTGLRKLHRQLEGT